MTYCQRCRIVPVDPIEHAKGIRSCKRCRKVMAKKKKRTRISAEEVAKGLAEVRRARGIE